MDDGAPRRIVPGGITPRRPPGLAAIPPDTRKPSGIPRPAGGDAPAPAARA